MDLRELLGEPHIDDQIDGYGSRSATTKVLRTRGQLDPNRVAGAPLCHACEPLRLTRVRPPPAKGGSESRGVLRRWEYLPTPTAGARVSAFHRAIWDGGGVGDVERRSRWCDQVRSFRPRSRAAFV